VIEVLEQLRTERGLPEVVIADNGSEFTRRVFDAWAYAREVKNSYIQPGKPVQNCYIERTGGTFRDECLNLHGFVSLEDARRTIEAWRADDNRVRPHSSLGNLTPRGVCRSSSTRRGAPRHHHQRGSPKIAGSTLGIR